MARRVGVLLLSGSLASVFLFDIIGPYAPLISWALAIAGFIALGKDPKSRKAASVAQIVLAMCIISSLTLTGIVIGANGHPLLHSPRFDPTPVAEVLGFVAAWLAAAAFLILVERHQRQRLAIGSALLLCVGAYSYAWGELDRAGIRIQPSFGIGGAGMTLVLLSGMALLAASLVRFARPRPNTRTT